MGTEERRYAVERVKVRAELRSAHEEEDSVTIDRNALERTQAKPSSTPPKAKAIAAVLNAKPSWSMVAVVAIFAAVIVSGALGPAVKVVVGWFSP
jgi:hypothetical protein